MQSVTSNAVAQALGGSKIKITSTEKSRTIFQYSSYGYVYVTGFDTGADRSKILGFSCKSDGIADGMGLQITLVSPITANGGAYFWYYIPNPSSFDYSGRTIIFSISYIED